jgi:hypothetical protein
MEQIYRLIQDFGFTELRIPKGEKMTNTPQRLEINCETGEQTLVPLTAEEIAELATFTAEVEKSRLDKENAIKALEATKTAALEKLTALGLTEEEARAIAGN